MQMTYFFNSPMVRLFYCHIISYLWCVALQPATLLKLTLLHEFFLRFLNCTNGTKSRNAPHFEKMTSYEKFGHNLILEVQIVWEISAFQYYW